MKYSIIVTFSGLADGIGTILTLIDIEGSN